MWHRDASRDLQVGHAFWLLWLLPQPVPAHLCEAGRGRLPLWASSHSVLAISNRNEASTMREAYLHVHRESEASENSAASFSLLRFASVCFGLLRFASVCFGLLRFAWFMSSSCSSCLLCRIVGYRWLTDLTAFWHILTCSFHCNYLPYPLSLRVFSCYSDYNGNHY